MALGLQKLNFKPQPPKAQASQGMSSQTRATGAATRGAVGQNVGKLDQRGTMALFGIDAQRSNRVLGNMKAGYSQGISNLRHSMNDYRMRIDEFWVNPSLLPTKNSQIQNSGMSDMQKLMELQALMGGITQMGKGVADIAGAIKDTKGSSAPKSKEVNDTPDPSTAKGTEKAAEGDPTVNKINSAVSSSISSMQGAKNAKSLETLINAAITNLNSVDASLKQTQNELQALQGKTATLEANVSDANAKLEENKANISSKQTQIGTLQSEYTTMQSTYNAMPSNTPEQKQAKAEFQKQVAAKKDELEKAQGELKKLQKETPGLEKDKAQADKDLADNKAQIETKNSSIASLTESKKSLEKELPAQRDRLEKMKKEEDPNYGTVQTALGRLNIEDARKVVGDE